jgi:hypothetical protein
MSVHDNLVASKGEGQSDLIKDPNTSLIQRVAVSHQMRKARKYCSKLDQRLEKKGITRAQLRAFVEKTKQTRLD